MLECSDCGVAVHPICYAAPNTGIRGGGSVWVCRLCGEIRDKKVSNGQRRCVLCPRKSGALVHTKEGLWVHTMCAIWIPETSLIRLEKADGLYAVPEERFTSLTCRICNVREGACIQCSYRQCTRPFHPYCARVGFMSLNLRDDVDTFHAYCAQHRSMAWDPELSPEDYTQDEPPEKKYFLLLMKSRHRLTELRICRGENTSWSLKMSKILFKEVFRTLTMAHTMQQFIPAEMKATHVWPPNPTDLPSLAIAVQKYHSTVAEDPQLLQSFLPTSKRTELEALMASVATNMVPTNTFLSAADSSMGHQHIFSSPNTMPASMATAMCPVYGGSPSNGGNSILTDSMSGNSMANSPLLAANTAAMMVNTMNAATALESAASLTTNALAASIPSSPMMTSNTIPTTHAMFTADAIANSMTSSPMLNNMAHTIAASAPMMVNSMASSMMTGNPMIASSIMASNTVNTMNTLAANTMAASLAHQAGALNPQLLKDDDDLLKMYPQDAVLPPLLTPPQLIQQHGQSFFESVPNMSLLVASSPPCKPIEPGDLTYNSVQTAPTSS
eukprot:Filipodium_phascolosomae@DN4564_c0_g1_i1.p1